MVSKGRTLLGLCLVVLALSAVAAASASASEFVFSKTGSLKGSALTPQTFVSAAGSWNCEKAKISGSATTLKTTTQKVTVQYEECVYFGVVLKATAAEYELNTNGSLTLLKKFTMSSTLCTIQFPAQTVSKLTYANKPVGKIEIGAEVTKITSSGTGSLCAYPEEKSTVLSGKSLLELEGGTAEVK
jgi:hypothetical protein